ncbi:MAG: BlaI/MecI/CopY family transcriptional regulator [Lachnospiraceae bacterium]|nr:BlaI/MecI/CopY family transcriptional regulator [Lachnospiraceae bacterium]
MARTPKGVLTENEFSILTLLWTKNRSLSRPEILENLSDNDWNPNSIHLILNSMIKKGVLKVDGVTRCGQNYGRTYAPTMTQEEYAASQMIRLTPNLPQSRRLLGIFAALVDKNGIDAQTIEEMEKLLAMKRKELELK